VLTVLHHVALAYLSHCIIWLLAHVCSYVLDHKEPKFEEPTEQAQAEAITNLVWIKASPGALTNDTCLLIYNICFMFYYDCALSL
jgi:hypothetical protein